VTRRSLSGADVAVGDELPTLIVPITPTRVVAGAIATRDFMPVHHDRDFANGQGAPDIFLNVISSNAYVTRFLTDWAGPDAMVKRLAVRMGAPAFPDATLTVTGAVTAVTADGDDTLVDVELRATTDLGDHVSGTATISLPGSPA
jgi:acyl dehydratase